MRLIRDVARVSDSTTLFLGSFAGAVTSLYLFAIGMFHGTDVTPITAGVYLATCSLSAYFYSLIFRSARRSGLGVGIQVAIIHWIVSGVIVSFSVMGPFAFNAGVGGMAAFLFAHLIFGMTVGVGFDRAAMGFDHPRPIGPVIRDQRELSRNHRVRGTIRA